MNSKNGLVMMLLWVAFLGFADFANATTCKTDRDCPRNFICVETTHGKGICVVDNNRPCHSNGGCPTGWLCISGTCSKGGAGQSCKSNGNCRTGYVCCNNRCVYSTCRDLFPSETWQKSFDEERLSLEQDEFEN
ncbi:MAG: Dickkopf N-terminal cysteine-rich domain-containing protein [Deltaproteobacteria bacterium]